MNAILTRAFTAKAAEGHDLAARGAFVILVLFGLAALAEVVQHYVLLG